jgi:bifunctional non-homologous end joining protein LigD
MIIKSVSLFFKSGGSDKEYHLQLVEDSGKFLVNFQYGRRGSTLKTGSKTPTPVDQTTAEKIYNKVEKEKLGEGYVPGTPTETGYVSVTTPTVTGPVPQLPNPINEAEVLKLLKDAAWALQEKKDGKHIVLQKSGSKVTATNKKGIETGFPAVFAEGLKEDILLDGEAIGETFYAFDLLQIGTEDLRGSSYQARYDALVKWGKTLSGKAIKIVPLMVGYKDKKALFDKLQSEKREGVVLKKLSAVYKSGRPATGGDMLKYKLVSTASCIVTTGREGKRSVALELIDNGKRIQVGNVTIPANKEIPLPETVCECRYLYAYPGGSLFQPVYLGPRDDIDPAECLIEQLKYKPEEIL